MAQQRNVLSFDLAKAREVVRMAKRVLEEAEQQFNSDHDAWSDVSMLKRLRGNGTSNRPAPD
jgi:hypothetical protein